MPASIDLVFEEPKEGDGAKTCQVVRGAVELVTMPLPGEAEINFKLLSTDESVLTATVCQAGVNPLKQTSIQFHGTADVPVLT